MQGFRGHLTIGITVLCLACGIDAAKAQGTNQAILETSIVEGQAAVPQTSSITFTLNRQLDFNSLFTRKFHWEPFGKSTRENVFLDADRTTPRFDLVHAAQTDFSAYVFGLFDADTVNVMARPFTLNYSTSPTMGANVVAGTAVLGDRQPPVAPDQRLTDFLNQTTENHLAVQVREAADLRPTRRNDSSFSKSGSTTNLHDANIDWTVVFLIDAFQLDERQRVVRAAAAVQADGSYSFSHVRDGTYYPLAVTFADQFGDAIGAYGYYDLDGDFDVDPIVVNGGNVSDVTLTIYPYAATTGLGFRSFAESIALNERPDASLVSMSSTSADSSGKAVQWTFLFYSADGDEEIHVTVDPLTVTSFVSASTIGESTTTLPTSGLVDSDAALALAEANGGSTFREDNSELQVSIEVSGGNLLANHPSNPTRLLWRVRYSAAGSVDAPLTILVDMTTGVVVGTDDEIEYAEGLSLGAFPNPWRDRLEVRFEAVGSGTVELSAYDLLGRRVLSVTQPYSSGAGTYSWSNGSLAPGVYVLHVSDGVSVATRSVVKF